MKKILIALAMVGLTYGSAEAQNTVTCGVNKGKVCKMSPNRKDVSCYKTKFAENYKVCKNDYGYFVCCETPNLTNSTHPRLNVMNENKQYVMRYEAPAVRNTDMQIDMTPKNQSYAYEVSAANSYEGYYANKNLIKVCYVGDNVAQDNLNPYLGCPSPQSEGPEVNKERNINVSNPISLPPLAGRSHE